MNLYEAFGNNPVNFIDPEGTAWWYVAAAIFIAAAQLWDNNKDHYKGYDWKKIFPKKNTGKDKKE